MRQTKTRPIIPIASPSGSPLRLRVAVDPETQLGTVLDGVDQTFRMQILVAFGGVEASKVHVIIYIDIYILQL